jgi:hypothetical protein
MKFDRQNALPAEDEVTRFERDRGVQFPDDYKDFLLRFNGGRPAEENAFVGDWLVLEILYGLTQNAGAFDSYKEVQQLLRPYP